jgi:20S proteasome subunit beta 7
MSRYSFLGYVDLLGTTYQSPTIATGFGAYIAQPLLRNAVDDRAEPLSENEAVAVIQLCMKALFYRDARSLNKVRSFGTQFSQFRVTDVLAVPNC